MQRRTPPACWSFDLATGKPIGINRLQFMSSLAKPFYKEIFLKRSCLAFMDKNPLVVEEGMPLPELSILMANGEHNVLSDGFFVIVADDRYQGMGYAQDVLSILSEVQLSRNRSRSRNTATNSRPKCCAALRSWLRRATMRSPPRVPSGRFWPT